MSSFKRKFVSKGTDASGTRMSGNAILVSSGIPSLDDVLGGGIPLSTSTIISASDPHSNYSHLVLKYGLAQGLTSGHRICIVGNDDARLLLHDCLWVSKSHSQESQPDIGGENIKIAWRYQQLKQFSTTVSSSSHHFCSTNFDLTCRVPSSVLEHAEKTGLLDILDLPSVSCVPHVLDRLKDILAQYKQQNSVPLRILIPGFGGPAWGDLRPESIHYFLWKLKLLLREYPDACACIAISPHLISQPHSSDWLQTLGWLADHSMQFSPFSTNPSLNQSFPAYHGFFRLHHTSDPHTLLSQSDKGSQLRFGDGIGEGGENNLAFKCTKRRLILETVHLDVEGGVGERRTTPATNSASLREPIPATMDVANANLAVELEGESLGAGNERKGKGKAKKSVAFYSDQPDVYDF